LTGERPPSASDVNEDGVPIDKLKAKGISDKAIAVICKAMESRKKDRMKRVSDFIAGLEGKAVSPKSPNSPKEEPRSTFKEKPKEDNDDTILKESKNKKKEEKKEQQPEKPKKKEKTSAKSTIKFPLKFKRTFLWVAAIVIVAIAGVLVVNNLGVNNEDLIEIARYTDDKTFNVGGVEFVMKPVEGGTFTMGVTSEQQEPDDNEKLVHQVTLSSFYIGETEVTQALWTAVMGNTIEQVCEANDFDTWGSGKDYPMYCVSWKDCQDFIDKLNSMTGKKFRLLTEAEWEYAARGGKKSRGYQYSGSNNLDDVAWNKTNSGSKTHPVKTKQPNELGIYDMSGNVDEFCQSDYGDESNKFKTNHKSSKIVARGGSFYRNGYVTNRNGESPEKQYNFIGFRLALSE
ncbi:MAG: formylglycine-generating enzyme family protein, partial [Bacteroidaceae bacterium]